MMAKNHILSILVENESGVLARVAGLFSARGFNIDGISVAGTLEKDESKMIISTYGDEQILEQITKQLNRLINVIKVQELTDDESVMRQTILVKVNADDSTKNEIFRIKEIFEARIVDVSRNAYVLEFSGSAKKMEAFIELIRPVGIKDIVKTGKIAITRSKK